MDFKATTTIYEQIAGMIEDNILSGSLPEGERLQSVRELASEVQVNPNTVQRTYASLQDSGVIRNQRGIGYFVADDARQQVLRQRRSHFEREALPEFFHQLSLLGVTPAELASLFSDYVAENPTPVTATSAQS